MNFIKMRLLNYVFWTVLIVAGVYLYLTPSPVQAQINPLSAYNSAFAKEQISVSTSALPLTAATYNPTVTDAPGVQSRAQYAEIECDTHPVKVWMDGSTPTQTVGITFAIGTIYTIKGYHDIVNLKMISADASTGLCNVQYYRAAGNQ